MVVLPAPDGDESTSISPRRMTDGCVIDYWFPLLWQCVAGVAPKHLETTLYYEFARETDQSWI